ncbi:Aggrecan core protein Cartilage-specific proteoglycan core protein [Channa argus]|uniref:Aggrecan core protein Cartilage-specific proteoglycan core protein n=1 Tax=Channa argus TaxID=215402 RepID=A0A6G1Q4I2_CHAAH|nr:Aggrecan core protein Cartilage-specific proteoglycan core protein [Channa argus]
MDKRMETPLDDASEQSWSLSTCLLDQYYYVPDLKNWTEAQSYCRQRYTDLATIGNTKEKNQLINKVLTDGYKSQVWIGLYNQINWTWSDGYTGSGADFRNWETSQNEPDLYSADQFCVSAKNAKWWDNHCNVKLVFICQRGTAGTQLDPDFVLVNATMNWTSAQSYCRQNFTDLATVTNNQQNNKIHKLLPSGEMAWIGLFRDHNFYWSDQSIFSFSDFDSVENRIYSLNVVCGVADLQGSKKWKFLSCDTRKPFVCYARPIKRQVMKLKVKLEDSSVDLNDPAVKAGILKKFQDRLKENGLSAVTLKWREQPDGKVFHKEKEADVTHDKC